VYVSLRTFATEALSDIQTTAAIVPSSRYLVRHMLKPLPLRQARTVVEFGPGTGVMTKALLQEMPPDAKLLAFEINPRFTEYLRERLDDPRLILINDCAETMGEALTQHGLNKVDAVVSSLGLTIMPKKVRQDIFQNLLPYTHAETTLTQFQYLHGMLVHEVEVEKLQRYSTARFLRGYFGSVSQKLVWRNLPPAVVFTCHQ
jgi:phospholipid N-methyltransferase